MRQIHVMCIPMHSQHLWQQRGASIKVWQNVFLQFIDSQLETAAWLMLIVRSMLARVKAIYISSMGRWVCESMSPQSTIYIRPLTQCMDNYQYIILTCVTHCRLWLKVLAIPSHPATTIMYAAYPEFSLGWEVTCRTLWKVPKKYCVWKATHISPRTSPCCDFVPPWVI